MNLSPTLLIGCLLLVSIQGKIYNHCQLGKELLRRWPNFFNRGNIATWVCIAKYESSFNTKAVSKPNTDGSRDYGIFQINSRYWCSPPGNGCNIPCNSLLTDNIDPAIGCIQTIYRRQGLGAWSTWRYICKNPSKAQETIRGCHF